MADKVKRIDPLTGALGVFEVMKDTALGREVPGREDVFRDEFEGVIVDTVKAYDTGEWETGVKQEDWTIVEQYVDREAAEAGHKKWVEKLRADPRAALRDIGVWEGMGDD